MSRFVFIMIVFLFVISATAQVIFQQPLSDRVVSYQMDVQLNVEAKRIKGTEIIRWRNVTSRPTDSLHFHMYLNAFRSSKTTFMRESGGVHRGFAFEKAKRGYVEIDSLLINGQDFTAGMQFVQPDDGNPHDSTVMVVVLPFQVKPGEEVEIYCRFTSQLPKVFARTGYHEDFFMVGQWFPKLGVLEEKGWNCHQFHANSEFYADFGVYDVTIGVPAGYVVGATGIPVDTVETDSLVHYTFRAEDVHDFAWTASPRYRKITRNIRGVEVELLLQPEHSSSQERYFEAMEHGLHYFGEWYMPYPYPKITVVDPPLLAFGAGGMEYPMLITGGTIWNVPSWMRELPEGVTIHEFGHQYFYGILASNEFEEAWLDEGMNTYSTTKIMTLVYGEWEGSVNAGYFKMGPIPSAHFSYIKRQRRGVILQTSWTYPPGGYSFNSYQKPTLVLLTLEKLLGEETMSKIWKEYFRRFAFKHPRTEDFITVVEEISGKNLESFFNQFVYGDAVVDYRVLSVTNSIEKKDSSGTLYRNEVWITRESDGNLPLEVRLVFENGDTIDQYIDSPQLAQKLEIVKESKIKEVVLDPERKLLLDINWTNNSWTADSRTAWSYYLRKLYYFWIQNAYLLLTN